MKRVLALLFLLLFAPPSPAGELCPGFGGIFPCPGYDVAFDFEYVGYSTDGQPCIGEIEGHDTFCRLSLSASSTDPNVNYGPLPADLRLYLWNTPLKGGGAPPGYGWGSLWVFFSGNFAVQSYEPIAAGTHDWSGEDQSLGFTNCDDEAPAIIGVLLLHAPTPVEPDSWGRVKSLYR